MQIKQEQRQESDATVKKVEDDRALATQVKFHSPHKNASVKEGLFLYRALRA